MSKYVVARQEVYIQDVEIEAESVEEALELVLDGEGDEIGELRYSYTIDELEPCDVNFAIGCGSCGSQIILDDGVSRYHHNNCAWRVK